MAHDKPTRLQVEQLEARDTPTVLSPAVAALRPALLVPELRALAGIVDASLAVSLGDPAGAGRAAEVLAARRAQCTNNLIALVQSGAVAAGTYDLALRSDLGRATFGDAQLAVKLSAQGFSFVAINLATGEETVLNPNLFPPA
jgi:hypothetical protein